MYGAGDFLQMNLKIFYGIKFYFIDLLSKFNRLILTPVRIRQMGNIEFSETAAAIMRNKALTSYLVSRLANITPEEAAAGEIEVTLKNGNDIRTVKFIIGRKNQNLLDHLQSKKDNLQPA